MRGVGEKMESKRKISGDAVVERFKEIKSVFEKFMTTYLFVLDSAKHVEPEHAPLLSLTLNYITAEVQDKLKGFVDLFVKKESQKIAETETEKIVEVTDTHIVEDGSVEKTFIVKTTYRIILKTEGKKTNVYHELVDIGIRIRELIDENTPFTLMLKEKLSLTWFKEPWETEVIDALYRLAEAERGGKLDEELARIIEKAESEPVLEYKLFLNAIARARKEYDEYMKKLRSRQLP
jgi:hypothetical protein